MTEVDEGGCQLQILHPRRIINFDIDCLRPVRLGCNGYPRPTSTTIDRFAGRGLRFDRYYCQSSPCLLFRAGLISGRSEFTNGVVSNHGAGARFRLRTLDYGGPAPDNEVFPRQLRRYGWDTYCFSNFADRHSAPWLKRNASRGRFFLHVNCGDAHRPYRMDPVWADRYSRIPVVQTWPDAATIAGHQDLPG